jgi:hypothetical protein
MTDTPKELMPVSSPDGSSALEVSGTQRALLAEIIKRLQSPDAVKVRYTQHPLFNGREITFIGVDSADGKTHMAVRAVDRNPNHANLNQNPQSFAVHWFDEEKGFEGEIGFNSEDFTGNHYYANIIETPVDKIPRIPHPDHYWLIASIILREAAKAPFEKFREANDSDVIDITDKLEEGIINEKLTQEGVVYYEGWGAEVVDDSQVNSQDLDL